MNSSALGKLPNSKKIWIDLDNSPHVLFFDPIIKELQNRGHEVVVTARDYAQVIGLADLFKLQYQKIGHHYGKNIIFKIFGLLFRTCQFIPFILREKPDIAFSHGSRSQIMAAAIFRFPSVLAFDYEYTTAIPIFKPALAIVPEVLHQKVPQGKADTIASYPGIKEDVYIREHKADPTFLENLGISNGEIIAAIRPPATAAHYHVSKSDTLFEAVLKHLGSLQDTKVIIVPRTKEQAAAIRTTWKHYFQNGQFIIPDHVINGLDLIWFSDLVISAGGTMIREAAALGVPAYSIFGGKTGAVDQFLQQEKKLTLLTEVDKVEDTIVLKKWSRPDKTTHKMRATLTSIVDTVETLLTGAVTTEEQVEAQEGYQAATRYRQPRSR